MMTDSELDARLVAWAKDYGGGRYENIGYSSKNLLQTLIDHGGFVPDSGGFKRPPIRTETDDVEKVVRDMEKSGLFKQASVLRCEYFMLDAAEEQKLARLRAIGLGMSRAGYYNFLAVSKAFVMGALTVASRREYC